MKNSIAAVYSITVYCWEREYPYVKAKQHTTNRSLFITSPDAIEAIGMGSHSNVYEK